jgi:sarcosine oxidase subunit beta
MKATPSVAVVGAGVAGLSAAVHLAQRGCQVTVLEKGQVASASSGLSVGVYTRNYADRPNIVLRMHAVRELEQLRDDHGLEMNAIGYLRLARTDEGRDELASGLALQHELGVTDGELLDGDEIARIVPDMDCAPFTSALWMPTDGYLDGHGLCMLYYDLARDLGVDIRVNAAVTAAGRGATRRHVLHTSRGDVEADVVVNAAGAWADRIGEMLGAPFEVNPERHQVCVVHRSKPFGYTVPEVMDYVPGSGDNGLWFRQEREDQLLVGLHSNETVGAHRADPDSYFRGVDADHHEVLAEMLLERLPKLEDLTLQTGWSGIYPVSADSQIVVGPSSPDPTVVIAGGLGGVGVHTAPAVGQIAADWILDGQPSMPFADTFSPARFDREPA